MDIKTLGKIQGTGLALLNRFAASPLPDKLHVRRAVEQLLFQGSKQSFKLTATLGKSFTPKQGSETVRLDAVQSSSGLFDLSLTDEQQQIVDSLQRFAQDVIRPAAHNADTNAMISDEVAAQAHDLGLIYYAVPEAFGGSVTEQQLVTQMLALETLAHGDFSLTAGLFATVSVANVLTRFGSAAQQATYLPIFVDDPHAIATLAVVEPTPLFNAQEPATVARSNAQGYLLTGEKSLVLQGVNAHLFLVLAQLDNKPALFMVEGGTVGLTVGLEPAMGLKAAQTARLKLDNVQVSVQQRVDIELQEFLDLSHLTLCSLAVGTAQAVLDYVIPYANEREAFGEPISHRQGVAFKIADMAIEIDAMRLMTWRACGLAESGRPFHREAHLAYILCCQKAMQIGTDGVQLLGGHGYTKEHPVERWYRDLRSVAVLQGALSL